MLSTMHAGFSTPSISIVSCTIAWTPPFISSTSVIVPWARMRELTGTGWGTVFVHPVIDSHRNLVTCRRSGRNKFVSDSVRYPCDRGTERAVLCLLWICVYPLVIPCRFCEKVDSLLRYFKPISYP